MKNKILKSKDLITNYLFFIIKLKILLKCRKINTFWLASSVSPYFICILKSVMACVSGMHLSLLDSNRAVFVIRDFSGSLFLRLLEVLKVDSNFNMRYLVDIVGVNTFIKSEKKDYLPLHWRYFKYDPLFVFNIDSMFIEFYGNSALTEFCNKEVFLQKVSTLVYEVNIFFNNEINYLIRSKRFGIDISIKILFPENKSWPTISDKFKGALWPERELWDLFGFVIKNHKDLRRILTDYGFSGNPLRKEFPMSGYKELRYDENKKRIVFESITIAQDFRRYEQSYSWGY